MPPVLLIPGNMCDARLWQPVASILRDSGHKVVDAPRLDQSSIASMAGEVERSIVSSAVVIGFSMGAIVAAELARRSPERIAALGLVAFNASDDLPDRAAVRPRQQEAVRQGHLEALVAEELKPNYLAEGNRGDTRLLSVVMQMARALGPAAFVAQSEALRLRADLQPALTGFRMPVLLACGSEDRLCPPEWHRRWAEMIGPNAKFVEVDGAGHLLPLERPEPLAGAMIDWLAKDALCTNES